MTPELPSFVRDETVRGFVNAHQLVRERLNREERRLYGTESACGDWNGRVLLLLKQFVETSFLEERIAAGDKDPYRHEPNLDTNLRLLPVVSEFACDERADRCGFLYGSAAANLLGSDRSEYVSAAAIRHGAEVLKFVLKRMPYLETIICFGSEAWRCVEMAGLALPEFSSARDDRISALCGRLKIIPEWHPAARGRTIHDFQESLRQWLAH